MSDKKRAPRRAAAISASAAISRISAPSEKALQRYVNQRLVQALSKMDEIRSVFNSISVIDSKEKCKFIQSDCISIFRDFEELKPLLAPDIAANTTGFLEMLDLMQNSMDIISRNLK